MLSSGGLAALLVLRAGGATGCDSPRSPPEQPVVAPAKAEPIAAPEVTPEPVVTAEPVQAPVKPGNDGAGDAGNAGNAAPRFLPASKSGVFIEHDAKPLPPAREPAVVEQASQQAGPK